MPHVTSGGRRMTNIPVGNGEFVQGIRKNANLNVNEDKGKGMPDLSPPHGMRPLRYTSGLACDAELERLRPERDAKHKPFTGPDQQQWRKKLIQHPATYDGSFVDADMQQFRPSPNPPPVTQDPWYASRVPEGQYYPANERLAGPGASLAHNPYESIYPQDELSRIKERNRRFANSCGQEVMTGPVSAQMGPYGYGAPPPPAVMPGYHMPMMAPMMPQPYPGMMAPPMYPPHQPNYALPPPLISQMDELRVRIKNLTISF